MFVMFVIFIIFVMFVIFIIYNNFLNNSLVSLIRPSKKSNNPYKLLDYINHIFKNLHLPFPTIVGYLEKDLFPVLDFGQGEYFIFLFLLL